MVAGWVARARSLWRGLTRGRGIDADVQDEFRLHMELRAADLVKAGMPPMDAERAARAEFGGVFDQTQAVRQARGLGWFDALRFSALDFKLGARMLKRYPGLTIIGSLSMGVAIAIGGAVFTVLTIVSDPSLPLPEGDRIVGLQVWNTRTNQPERRLIHQLAQWRAELSTVRELAAFRGTFRNVITSDGKSAPTRAVAMTASGFRIAGVAPLLGRYFLEEDEKPGAPPVAVLSHELWESRFAGDSGIVGRNVMLGPAMHTIVGVMPPGFRFPMNYTLWVPFKASPLAHKPGEGPAFLVFGRLATGATLEEARTQLAAIAARNARELPATQSDLRPAIVPYAQSWLDLDSPDAAAAMNTARLMVALLLILICSNIATLVYARTATRQREIAVRSALGASRARIVSQLFGEALLLAAVGAVIGLGLVSILASQIDALLPRMGVAGIPYWLRFDVSGATLRHVSLLAVAGAAIIGILPALQVTGRRVQRGLQSLAGGQASIRLGGMWTALIVAQVAITVGVLPTTVFMTRMWVQSLTTDPGFVAKQVLSARLSMDREVIDERMLQSDRVFLTKFAKARDELLRRVRADAGVAGATFASDAAGTETYQRWALDTVLDAPKVSDPFANELSVRARLSVVDVDYFRALEVPLVMGRSFGPADADSSSRAVVVNRSFVSHVLRGRNPIGRQIRSLHWTNGSEQQVGPWLEIVGVVGDFPTVVDVDRPTAAVYQAARSTQLPWVTLHIRTAATDASAFAARLSAMAADVQPALQLRDILPMDEVFRNAILPLRLLTLGMVIVTLSVVILSAAGIYALMSVVVTQRRREIGIRMALGADRRRVLGGVFKRAFVQLGAGAAIGIMAATALRAFGGSVLSIMAPVVLITLTLGFVAAMGPARRALGISPNEVLREDQ